MKTLTILFSLATLCSFQAATAAPDLSSHDEMFIKKAALGGMTEVRLGEIATEKARQPAVKEFGAMMVKDHSKANTELKALAKSKNVELPADLDSKHQSTVDRFSKLSADEFDKAYVKEMVEDHKKDVAEFEEAAKSAKDAEVKAFAEKTLPTLRTHLEHVMTLHKQVEK
jgi:putative membrane protein